MPDELPTASCLPGRRLPRPLLLSLLLAAMAGLTGCEEPSTPGDATGERADRRVLELALETRRLHEETVEAGRRLVDGRGEETDAASRLRALSRDARELAARIGARVAGAPEAGSLREAVEQVERGAERLLAFDRFGRPNVLLAGSDALEEADRELDDLARRLDSKLGENARGGLDDLRREVPEIAGAETASRHHGRTHTGLRPWFVNAMARDHGDLTRARTRGQGEPASLL